MLNIKGAYVIIGTAEPIALLLSVGADELFSDRIGAVGYDKAIRYTFGETAAHALPCTIDCMEFIALNYQGEHSDKVRQLCARIALKQPIGDGKDLTDDGGGIKARLKPTEPKTPSGALAQVVGAA